jgi:hypothetical protein
MTMTPLSVLRAGECEFLKAGIHATALGLSAVMGLYNLAAWLSRRQRHLAMNACLYALLTAWEQQHVAHHLSALRDTGCLPGDPRDAAAPAPVEPLAA